MLAEEEIVPLGGGLIKTHSKLKHPIWPPPPSLGEECCKNCCYSTPYLTLGAVVCTLVGLTGFTISSVYGVVQLSTVPHLQNR